MFPNTQERKARVRHISLPTLFESGGSRDTEAADNEWHTEKNLWTKLPAFKTDRSNGRLPDITNQTLQKHTRNDEKRCAASRPKNGLNKKLENHFGELICAQKTTNKVTDSNDNDVSSLRGLSNENELFEVNNMKEINGEMVQKSQDPLLTRRKVGKMYDVKDWVNEQAFIKHDALKFNGCQNLPEVTQNSTKTSFRNKQDSAKNSFKEATFATRNLEEVGSPGRCGFGGLSEIHEKYKNYDGEDLKREKFSRHLLTEELKDRKLLAENDSKQPGACEKIKQSLRNSNNSILKTRRHSMQSTRFDSPFPIQREMTHDMSSTSRKISLQGPKTTIRGSSAFSWPGSSIRMIENANGMTENCKKSSANGSHKTIVRSKSNNL